LGKPKSKKGEEKKTDLHKRKGPISRIAREEKRVVLAPTTGRRATRENRKSKLTGKQDGTGLLMGGDRG